MSKIERLPWCRQTYGEKEKNNTNAEEDGETQKNEDGEKGNKEKGHKKDDDGDKEEEDNKEKAVHGAGDWSLENDGCVNRLRLSNRVNSALCCTDVIRLRSS